MQITQKIKRTRAHAFLRMRLIRNQREGQIMRSNRCVSYESCPLLDDNNKTGKICARKGGHQKQRIQIELTKKEVSRNAFFPRKPQPVLPSNKKSCATNKR